MTTPPIPIPDKCAAADDAMCTKCFIPLTSDSTDVANAARALDMDDKGTQTSIEDYVILCRPEQMFGHDVGNHPLPIFHTELFNQQMSIDQSMLVSTNDGRDLPPPIRMPCDAPISSAGRVQDSVEEGKFSTNDLICNLDKEMQYEADQVRASEKCKDRPTQHEVPLDFNLTCPVCSKVFRKGQIQRYREHVNNCKGSR